MTAIGQLQTVISVVNYGANGSDKTDDTQAVRSALKAAEHISSTKRHTIVKVFFPSGRYIISSPGALVIPSYVVLSGSTTGESIIINRPTPGAEPFIFSTRNPSDIWSYMSIARADDTSKHPAVPNKSYQGLNYVYLKETSDIQALRNLGVPSKVSSTYSGLKSGIASGATLGNNYGTEVSQNSNPKLTIQKDPGVNPTPVNFNTILAVNDEGKVTLRHKSRLNWGVDAHTSNESLETYYNPSYSDSQKHIVTGPAWIVPADKYHHDILFENLVFEADVTKSNQLYGTYALYIGYAYNVSVENCKFRNMPGAYPILIGRAYNILIKDSQFTVQGYQGLALDASSGIRLSNNQFQGESWSDKGLPKLPPTAINFIAFDELPIDIDLIHNQFSNLKYVSSFSNRSGQAINGMGGAYLRAVDNIFNNIERAVIGDFGFNSNVIIDSNIMHDSEGLLFSGTGASMANLYNNRYTGGAKVRTDGTGFDSYNYRDNQTNYVCKNHGVTINQLYYPTSYIASNSYQDGTPITSTNLINAEEHTGVYDVIQTSGELNPVKICSISFSASNIKVNSYTSITVNLSAPTSTNFPFYFIADDGDLNTIQFQNFLLLVPTGQQRITIPDAVLGVKPGITRVSAKPLCSTTTQSASARLRIH